MEATESFPRAVKRAAGLVPRIKMPDMTAEFSVLEGAVAALRGPVYYLPNPGNWGDALIRQGTLKFFREIGLDYLELPVRGWFKWLRPRFRAGSLIYGGGGAWCRLWSHSTQILDKRGPLFEQVLVLPSTYERTFEHPRTKFLRRDLFESKTYMPGAAFCHDMAFYLGRQSSPRGTGIGHFFRVDAESAGRTPIPEGNCDISQGGDHLSNTDAFFEQLARYEVIRTDRLHVAVAACLLGKELHLYPGAYFKNWAIFRSSMLGSFENIHFKEHEGS